MLDSLLSVLPLAQAATEPTMMQVFIRGLLAALIYSALGIVVLAIAWFVIVRICPFSVRKEIEEDQNTALAIVAGSVIIGISLIIAAAITG